MKPQPPKACKGNVLSFTLPAPMLSHEKTVWLYLPHNYDVPGKRFPIVYMHDGQNVFDHSETERREWHAEEKLNSLGAETIVAGISHSDTTHRIDELTPYKNEKYGGGHADDYLDFIVNSLKPYIDENYKTLPGKENTVIFGSSVGGLISFYALLKFPEVFGSAGVFSPSFWFSKEIFNLIGEVNVIDGRIYFMAGDRESMQMVPDIEKMEQLVLERITRKENLYKKIVHNGKHNEKLWAREFAEAFTWLMKGTGIAQ